MTAQPPPTMPPAPNQPRSVRGSVKILFYTGLLVVALPIGTYMDAASDYARVSRLVDEGRQGVFMVDQNQSVSRENRSASAGDWFYRGRIDGTQVLLKTNNAFSDFPVYFPGQSYSVFYDAGKLAEYAATADTTRVFSEYVAGSLQESKLKIFLREGYRLAWWAVFVIFEILFLYLFWFFSKKLRARAI